MIKSSKYLEDFFVQDNEGFEGADHDEFDASHDKNQKGSTLHKRINSSILEHKIHIKANEEDKIEISQKNNELPEANPLLSSSKPTDFKPRILIKDYQYMDLPYILHNNVDTKYKNRHDSDQEDQIVQDTPSTTIQQEEEIQGVQQDDEKISQSLYQKYELSKKYEKVYCKYKQEKSIEEQVKSFAGYYINLSYVMDFGSTMFNTFQENKMNRPEYNYEFDLYNRIDQGKKEEFSSKQEQISFDSRFECGNLYQVYTKSPNKEYDLLLQNDINTKGYTQWFFFKVSNYKFKGLTVKFNIVNIAKPSLPFKQGMKISVFSLKENKLKNNGWMRKGKDIQYFKNKIIKEQDPNQYYYTLSFTYRFKHEDDEIYFAMNPPYSYTKMTKHLDYAINKSLKEQPNIIIKKDILCYSVSNNAVPLLSITEKSPSGGESSKEQLKNKNKKLIVIIARQHPGETVCSYKMEGVINFLISNEPEAQYLRQQFIFKIIPMMNPDGVIYGNFRCNISGVDINRQWQQPSRILHPSVYHAKKMIATSREEGLRLEYFIDLHGHSKKMNSFIYACRKDEDLVSCRVFPVIYSKISSIFQFKDCTFSLEQYKESAARIVMWNEINKIREQFFECFNIFTVETSFFGYKIGKKNEHFLISDLLELGEDLLKSVYINHKGEDKELYPNINRQEIIDKMNEDIQQFVEKESKDSGSDSDPLADELNIDEKLGSIIPIKIAKKLGFELKTKQSDKISSIIQQVNGMNNSVKDKNKKQKKKSIGNQKNIIQNGQQIIFQQLQTLPLNSQAVNSPQKDSQAASNSTGKAKNNNAQDFSQSLMGTQVASSLKKRNSLLFSDSQAHKFQNKQKSKFYRGQSENRSNVLNYNGITYLTTEENTKTVNVNNIETTPFSASNNESQNIQASTSIVIINNPELINQPHQVIQSNSNTKKVIIFNSTNTSNLIQPSVAKTSTPIQSCLSPSQNPNTSAQQPQQTITLNTLKDPSILFITEKNKIKPSQLNDSQVDKQRTTQHVSQRSYDQQIANSPLSNNGTKQQTETPIRSRHTSDILRQQITTIQSLQNQQNLHIAFQTTLNSASLSNNGTNIFIQANQFNTQPNNSESNTVQLNNNSNIVINNYQSNQNYNNQQGQNNKQTFQISGNNIQNTTANKQTTEQNLATNNSIIIQNTSGDQSNNQAIKIKNSPNPSFQIKQRNINGGAVGIKKQDLRTKSSTTHQTQPANIEMQLYLRNKALMGNNMSVIQNNSNFINNNNLGNAISNSQFQQQQQQNNTSSQVGSSNYSNNRLVNVGYQSLIQKVQLLGMQKRANTKEFDEPNQSPLKYQHSLQTQTERQNGLSFLQSNQGNNNNTQVASNNQLEDNFSTTFQSKQFQQAKINKQKFIDRHLVRSTNKPLSQHVRNNYSASNKDSSQVNKTDQSFIGSNNNTQPDENNKNQSSSPKRYNTQLNNQKLEVYFTNANNTEFIVSNQSDVINAQSFDIINSSTNGFMQQNQKVIKIAQTKLIPIKDDQSSSNQVDNSSSLIKNLASPLQLLGKNPSQKKIQLQQIQQQNQHTSDFANLARNTLRSNSLQKGTYVQVKEPSGQDPLMLTFTRLNRNQTNNINNSMQKELAGIDSNRMKIQQANMTKTEEINYNKKYQAAQRSLKLNQLMINEARINSANQNSYIPNKQMLAFNDAHLVNKI
ncbi:zinc carboxypeptidase family protein (macronuclear) [Tetrahymena thermophila SB210]|uniref:Zinc carboxypeptidase family protein n=1 Tax=Tetrahymena thermophila (strain SB210) TaxID=312017 RepID=W7XF98_TETTS|nr:zinc carboxypeptidase family protein [Tetrahymena thermophila SB210]EWS72671.1 zinc carboxypeptidase family protein [Tetrahymena thermophila SB210]|eukprot:XP_012654796.1 zinc carboxypeptidase family protein [Tetrahymena thermophila SB210]